MKILLFDIETSPIKTEGWSMYQEPVRLVEDWRIICFSYKWLGDDKIHFVANWHFGSPKNDRKTATKIRDLFDEADAIIAHNCDKFDNRKSKARFIYHGLTPPSPYRTIDTLKIARKEFAFTSNRLDELAKVFKIQGKLQHESFFEMWDKIKKSDKKTQRLMELYNKQDIKLLEQVYYKLRPYITTHPNMNIIERSHGCPKCGSHAYQPRGETMNNTGIYNRYYCTCCHSWFQDRKKQPFNAKYKI